MDFLINNALLILLAVTSGGMLFWGSRGGANGGGRISASEAVRLINREKGVLIDVGEPAEFAAGHAVGARNLPLGSLEGAKGLPSNKTLPLIIVCPTGARSGRAAALLRKQGYERVLVLASGMRAWREASMPVESSPAA